MSYKDKMLNYFGILFICVSCDRNRIRDKNISRYKNRMRDKNISRYRSEIRT